MRLFLDTEFNEFGGELISLAVMGKLVSGLHVWNNLAVLPAPINRSKQNRYTP